MLAHAYNAIIDQGAGEPGHVREVFNGLNDTFKRFLSILLTTVKLTGAKVYKNQTAMHKSILSKDISLKRE